MSRGRTKVLVGLLAFFALCLHLVFFSWSYDGNAVFSNLLCDVFDKECHRIWYRAAVGDHYLFAAIAGVLIPIALLCYCAFLGHGLWESRARSP
jgi:hypothetical protein